MTLCPSNDIDNSGIELIEILENKRTIIEVQIYLEPEAEFQESPASSYTWLKPVSVDSTGMTCWHTIPRLLGLLPDMCSCHVTQKACDIT